MYVGRMKYVTGAIACVGVAASTMAQPIPDYGHTFMTVGAAGNRAATAAERNNGFDPGINFGAVGYGYRITQTEVTSDQWLEFVRAYAPFNSGDPGDYRFTGTTVSYLGNGQYIGGGQVPATAGWHFAARYVNWLCNGKVNEAWAFESGAYDTTTFTINPDGSRNDQASRSPGARFWIPSFEESFKAFYYDPNRYGPGQEGYWMYPNGSNVPLVSGPPGEGTTNTGTVATHGSGQWYQNVGSYADVRTPWGLLDASGGEVEWLETLSGNGPRNRFYIGSGFREDSSNIESRDRIDAIFNATTPLTTHGFRVASVVPSPAGAGLAWSGLVWGFFRRRR
jgi:hypothetical protein